MIDDRYGLERHPWERMPDETNRAYAGFVVYRDLGRTRTLRKAAVAFLGYGKEDDFDPSKSEIRRIERWSATNRWVARAEAWDEFLQRQEDAELVDEAVRMKKRHTQLSAVMTSKIATYLNTLTDTDLARMTPDQAMRVLDLAIKNERLSRGIPDTIQGHTNADGGAVEVAISDDALNAKMQSWLASRDPDNRLELGDPDEERDDAAEAEEP